MGLDNQEKIKKKETAQGGDQFCMWDLVRGRELCQGGHKALFKGVIFYQPANQGWRAERVVTLEPVGGDANTPRAKPRGVNETVIVKMK